MTDEIPCVSIPGTTAELDEAGYLEANPDVSASGLSPRDHFNTRGRTEGRLQSINRAEIARMRDQKLARLTFRHDPLIPRHPGGPVNFLPQTIIDEFEIPGSPPVSAHPYIPPVLQLIRDNPEKLFLDVGAGLRQIYHLNVVNTEIYASVSTDVLCVGEALPFADAQFDFVFCFATLEHTRRPWDVAREICRVLKPGGMVVTDYPFLQPVHGYPHHYFNATPMGHQSLFEQDCEICGVELGWHHHPIVALQWSLTVFRNGLPLRSAHEFEQMRIKDLLDRPVEQLIDAPYSRELDPDMKRVIASGSLLVAVKRDPGDNDRQRAAAENGRRLAMAARPVADPADVRPATTIGIAAALAGMRRRLIHLRQLPPRQRLSTILRAVRRRIGRTS